MNEIEGMNNYLCPRAQPENINNVHALSFIHEPRSYIINDIQSFIRHYFADSYLQSSKNTRKSHQFYKWKSTGVRTWPMVNPEGIQDLILEIVIIDPLAYC